MERDGAQQCALTSNPTVCLLVYFSFSLSAPAPCCKWCLSANHETCCKGLGLQHVLFGLSNYTTGCVAASLSSTAGCRPVFGLSLAPSMSSIYASMWQRDAPFNLDLISALNLLRPCRTLLLCAPFFAFIAFISDQAPGVFISCKPTISEAIKRVLCVLCTRLVTARLKPPRLQLHRLLSHQSP